jgi:hypothetical protein
MRVVLFGASGSQGRRALRVLVQTTGLSSIIAVSRDPERAAATAASFPGSLVPVRPVAADIRIAQTLAAVLEKDDLVLNAAAPFFELGARLARACVASGAHYADICDDWEATVEILSLDAEARARGVSLTTGFGSAPGVDNMLALAAGSALDRVDRLITAWSLGGGEAGPTSLTPYKHLLQCCVGPIRLVRDGQLVDEMPLQPMTLDYPGVGPIAAWTIGSPEAVTLQGTFPGVVLCVNLVRAPADSIEGLRGLAEMVRSGNLAFNDAADLLRGAATAPSPAEPDQAPRLFALAEGVRGGRTVVVGAHLRDWPSGDYTMAGAALGAAARLRVDGLLSHLGAASIENAVSAPDYLSALAAAAGVPRSQAEIVLRYEMSGVTAK